MEAIQTKRQNKIDLRLVTPEIIRVMALSSLMSFIPYTSPQYNAPLHLKPMCNVIDRIKNKQSVKALITTPPQHFKTSTLMHAIPYVLHSRPELMFAYASYSSEKAQAKTIKALDYAIRTKVDLNFEYMQKKLWFTKQDGGLLTTSIEGGSTGDRVNVYLIDDPVKDRIEAESTIRRETVWDWFTDVVETRLRPDDSIIIVMTRWHDDDLGGRIIKNRPEFEIIRLPALCDNLDITGRNEQIDYFNREYDTALLPEVFPTEYLRQIRDKKKYTFTSLYQGLPQPREGRIFKTPFFYSELPKEGYQLYAACDLAYTEKSRADHSAITVLLNFKEKNYVIYNERWQKDLTFTKNHLKFLQTKYNTPFGIEANGPQKAVYDTLEDFGLDVIPIQPIGDKLARSYDCAEDWNNGDLLIPDTKEIQADWLNDFLEEITNFTGIKDSEDDRVDSLVYAHKLSKQSRPFFEVL